MPDLLLELFSEEIPARMQARAAEDLKKLVTDGLVDAGLVYEGAVAFATPRRLALHIAGLPAASPDTREERKGPRVGSPDKAIQGFLRGAGLTSVNEAAVASDPKKGDFYVAVIQKPGRPATEVISEVVPDVIRRFPWPKSMRWGTGSLRWVRPLHSILCVFGPETEETEIVDFEIGGIRSGRVTRGHRFMGPGEIEVRRFADYEKRLEMAKVILDPARRREIIRTDAQNLAFAQGFEVVRDEALLDEVAGLVEWPVVLMGAFEEAFLDIPPEVVRLTIRNNQKCFVLRNQASGRLTNRFLMVANIEAADGGVQIVSGNERVIAARLSDARFFWNQDRQTKLAEHARKLADITFHEKLGTQAERVERIARLARELSDICGADPDQAEQAARLCKADLVTGMVGEFPEVQGVMGRYYALAEGLDLEIADAIRDHYRPAGQGDEVPTAPVSIAVALADKLDTLAGFWLVNEKPTSSGDPFALRRATLGFIRLTLVNQVRFRLQSWILRALSLHLGAEIIGDDAKAADLIAFFADRLKVHLRDTGARYDLIDAVFALGGQDDLVMIVRRVAALGRFLDSDDGANLLTGVKRAANILRIEEKKDGCAYDAAPDPDLFKLEEEKTLADAINLASQAVADALSREDYEAAMAALAGLRAPVDSFFDHVTVNAPDAAVRANRLALLNRIREATARVADFSRIEG